MSEKEICEICEKEKATHVFNLTLGYDKTAKYLEMYLSCHCCTKCFDILNAGIFPCELMKYIKSWIKELREMEEIKDEI